jgi:hypothetical protein
VPDGHGQAIEEQHRDEAEKLDKARQLASRRDVAQLRPRQVAQAC